MCLVHVNEVCDGEVPECYVVDGVLEDLVAVINDAESYFDERYEVCCSLYGCNCYDNHKSDMADAIAKLTTLGFSYVDSELRYIGEDIPASVDNAQESYYPDAF